MIRPNVPGLSGFLNYRGQVIPILNLREILELPAKELSASDRIIMVRSWNTLLGFFVDEALGVYDIHQMQVISADFEALNIGPAIEGFIQCGEKMIVIQNLQKFLASGIPRFPESLQGAHNPQG